MSTMSPMRASHVLNSNKHYPGNMKDVPKGLYFNCYGYTAFMANWVKEPYWVAPAMMEEFLKDFTEPIKDICVGAILVMHYAWGEISHTALVYAIKDGEPQIVHKPGSGPMEVLSLSDLVEVYASWGTVTEYRYPKEI